MATLQQFTYGAVTPVLAYALSVLGSLLGLVATARAQSTVEHRARWLVLAAWALGGTAIWTMHFMAMIGFSVEESPVRYDIAGTVASWLISVLVAGIGLFIVGYGRPSVAKVLIGGPLTGLGVAAMHYTGMQAMHVNGVVVYDRAQVIASVVIASVAASVALYFTVRVRRPRAILGSALIMGIAVSGMHYTGMYALRIYLHQTTTTVSGVEPMAFLIPILVFVILVVIALAYALLAAPSRTDREFADRLRAGLTAVPAPAMAAMQPSSAFAVPSQRPGGRPGDVPSHRAPAMGEPVAPRRHRAPAAGQRDTALADRIRPRPPARRADLPAQPPVDGEAPVAWTGVPVSQPRR